jgi:hypothetical protein
MIAIISIYDDGEIGENYMHVNLARSISHARFILTSDAHQLSNEQVDELFEHEQVWRDDVRYLLVRDENLYRNGLEIS